jgi:geranylgeranyl diphosphate synthase, type II
LENISSLLEQKLQEFIEHNNAQNESFYQPVNYILNLGGKRMRPLLTLLSAQMYNQQYVHNALPAALAIEVFHNFSLLHDDIMDNAPIRRKQPTVHLKWNVNTAILSGDTMLVQAFQLLMNTQSSHISQIHKLFAQTAIEVCEGQQQDMDFETLDTVSESQYLKMIELKTAVLLAAALQIGAMVANASTTDQSNLYNFGRYIGIAFQLQDDILDSFGEEATFGKKIGGDILANKKTFLVISALKNANTSSKQQLQEWYKNNVQDNEKINAVKEIFIETNAKKLAEEKMDFYYTLALEHLQKVEVEEQKKEHLLAFANMLKARKV